MRLPLGVTGFRSSRKARALPETDIRAFRGHCYAAARILSGTVLGFELPNQYTNNFAVGILSLGPTPVAVLLNAHFPLVGLAEPPTAGVVELRWFLVQGVDCPLGPSLKPVVDAEGSLP